jgi:hypothetical protein
MVDLRRIAEVATAARRITLPRIDPLLYVLRHPMLMYYHQLIALVGAVNLAILAYALTGGRWWTGHGIALSALVTTAQANLALAIIVRQQHVINLACWLATRPPTTWPLPVRRLLLKVYHLGGLHVGGAVCGATWYLAFVGSSTVAAALGTGGVKVENLVLSYALVTLLGVVIVMALPPLRTRQHDRFEATHRFFGWAAVVLVWANTVLFVTSRGGAGDSASLLLHAPSVWLLVLTTISTLTPWALLRRVRITVERPSSHVALVGFDHGVTPAVGTVRAISRNPFFGWHTFASVAAPGANSGRYLMVVSRAGDWTADFIDHPPSHVWVRGVPTAGMANVRRLFKKVVFVATGSGIGPMLAHLLAGDVPAHLVWVTRNPRRTYGDALVDEILAAQPDATIWDTDEDGRPDVVELTYAAYRRTGAEAVICIANSRVTWRVVHAMESRGIPANGPIWDS